MSHCKIPKAWREKIGCQHSPGLCESRDRKWGTGFVSTKQKQRRCWSKGFLCIAHRAGGAGALYCKLVRQQRETYLYIKIVSTHGRALTKSSEREMVSIQRDATEKNTVLSAVSCGSIPVTFSCRETQAESAGSILSVTHRPLNVQSSYWTNPVPWGAL